MASKKPPQAGNICQRFLAAKLLAFAAIIMLIGTLVNITALVVPFWFSVKSAYITDEGVSLTTDSMGLFLYLKEDSHTSYDKLGLKEINRVQKATNSKLVPATMQVAQILWLLGTTVGGAACGGLFLVAASPYIHQVAEIGIAAALTGGGLSLLFSVVLSFASLGETCTPEYNWCHNMWKNTTVTLDSINWGFFVAILGAVMMIVSAVMIWMQFCRTLRAVEYIRSLPYHPLDDEPEYLQYDYRKTVRPDYDEYHSEAPMITLPQMHDDPHGYPGVVLSGPPPAYAPPYNGEPSPRSARNYDIEPHNYDMEPSPRSSRHYDREPSPRSSRNYDREPSPRTPRSVHSYGGSQEVSF